MKLLSKRTTALAAVILSSSLALTACGGDDGNGGGGGGDSDVSVTMLPKNLGNPYFDTSTSGAKTAAEELGVSEDSVLEAMEVGGAYRSTSLDAKPTDGGESLTLESRLGTSPTSSS